jgi:WD40 repeat protein
VVNRQSELLADTQADGSVALVNLRTLRLARTLPARDGLVANAVSFLPDGTTLANGGSNGKVTLWDVSNGHVARELRFSDPVAWTAASPHDKLLAVQTQAVRKQDSRVDVVDVATGRVLQSHTVGHGSGGLDFSPDGAELIALGCCGRGSTVVAWNTRSGRQIFSRDASDHASAIDVAPDSRLVGVGTQDGKVLFLDARSGKPALPPIQAATGNIAYLTFSADGRSLAVGAADNAVSTWDLRSRKRLGNPFGPYPGFIPSAIFEPSGRLLIGDAVESGVEWPIDVRTWERFACRTAGRGLTRQEWNDLVANRPYRQVCPYAR